MEIYGYRSAINKTSVTVTLKDTPSASPGNEDFNVTVGGEEVAVTNVTPVISDVTGKTFQLAVNLDKKAGKVSINGVESTTSFDYVAPTIANVKALDSKHIAVIFSEELAADGANDIANYSLYDVNSGTLHALAASFNSGAATAKLQADKKTVVITFSGAITDGNGFVLGGLTNGKYLLYVDQSETNKIQDLATPANQVLTNSNFEFNGTTAPGEVSIKAQSASYSKAEKVLTVTLNEPTDATNASVDASKFALSNGATSVALTGATVDATAKNTEIKFTLTGMSAEDYAKVEALTGNLNVVIADGAYKDANGMNAKGNTVAVTEKVLPVITGAAYNTESNVLKLNFDQNIDVSKVVDLSSITVNGQSINPGATVKTTTNGKTVEIQLTKAQAKVVEATGTDIRVKTVEDTAVVVPANLFTKVGATTTDKGQNVATTIAKAPITHDAIAPTVEFNIKNLGGDGAGTGTGTLTITGSEELDAAATGAGKFDGTKVKFYAADDMTTALGSLAAEDVLGTAVNTSSTAFEIDLATNSAALADQINTAVAAGKKIVTTIEKDAIKDINLTGNKAIEKEAPLNVSVAEATYGNAVNAIAEVTETSSLVTATFKDTNTDDVQLDATVAKNDATYEFVSVANPSIKVAGKAEYVWNASAGTGELRIVPVTPLAPGSYTLTMTGLKTNAGLAVEDIVDTGKVELTVSIAADTTAPSLAQKVINVVDKDKSGTVSAGDQIVLTFDEPIKLTGASAADFIVDGGHTLGSASVAKGTDSTQVVITLASNSTIALGDKITVKQTDKITDLAGNQVAVSQQTNALLKPVGVQNPTIKEAKYADTNADGSVTKGDTLTVKFDQVVKLAANKTATDLINDITVGSATFSSASLSGDTLTLVIDTPDIIAVGVNADVNTGNVDLQNGWGDVITSAVKAITSDDKTAPKTTGFSYNVATGANQLTVAFDEAVNVSDNGVALVTKLKADNAAAFAGVTAASTTAKLSDDKKSVILTLDEPASIDEFTTLTLSVGAISTVKDASGNTATRGKGSAYTVAITNVTP